MFFDIVSHGWIILLINYLHSSKIINSEIHNYLQPSSVDSLQLFESSEPNNLL